MVERGENQGVEPRLGWVQVSVSPQGFPSEKNLQIDSFRELHTLFTGQVFIVADYTTLFRSPVFDELWFRFWEFGAPAQEATGFLGEVWLSETPDT
jgi:hypothetical protein